MEDQNLARIATSLEQIARYLTHKPEQLGLSTGSGRKYLYVGEVDGCCWYFRRDDKNVAVSENSLTGRVTSLELHEKEYKGETKYKLRIGIDADIKYCVESGIETFFSKGVLLALELLDPNSRQDILTISVRAGESDKVVFSTVRHNGQPLKPDWEANKHTDYIALARRLGDRWNQKAPAIEPAAPVEDRLRANLMAQIDRHLKDLGWYPEFAKQQLIEKFGKSSRQLLTEDQLADFALWVGDLAQQEKKNKP